MARLDIDNYGLVSVPIPRTAPAEKNWFGARAASGTDHYDNEDVQLEFVRNSENTSGNDIVTGGVSYCRLCTWLIEKSHQLGVVVFVLACD